MTSSRIEGSIAHPQPTTTATVESVVQVLACRFTLVTDDADLHTRLEWRVQHATQSWPISRHHRLEGRRTEDGLAVLEDGREVAVADSPARAAELLLWRMFDLSLEAMPEFSKLHAGCATWGGRRFLLAGPAEAGKTTLLTKLLFAGFDVHCDDTVLVRDGLVLPYPRRFHIRRSSMPLLPELASLKPPPPGDESHLFLDPTTVGRPWSTEARAVDVVVLLDPRRDGPSRFEPLGKVAAAQRIMGHSNLPADGGSAWVRDMVTLVNRARCFVLYSSLLESTVAGLCSILEEGEHRSSS